jgi:hypothetical protein
MHQRPRGGDKKTLLQPTFSTNLTAQRFWVKLTLPSSSNVIKEAVSKSILRQFFYKTFVILRIILYIYA